MRTALGASVSVMFRARVPPSVYTYQLLLMFSCLRQNIDFLLPASHLRFAGSMFAEEPSLRSSVVVGRW